MRLLCLIMFTMHLVPSNSALADDPMTSKLWGEAGERWTSDSRLPDFSYAGYRFGEAPLPDVAKLPRRSVREFGARGDGEHDDTAAFQAALEQVESGVIEIPPGRYVISGILTITRPNLVLAGAGEGKTTLYFPRTLSDIEPDWGATTDGRRTSNYSWSGGFVRIRGRDAGRRLGAVAAPAQRGATELVLEAAADVKPGDSVRLVLTENEQQSLARYLYADDPGDIKNMSLKTRVVQVFRVTAVQGERIQVDRPLRFDVRREWKPTLHTFEPTVTDSGIEGMTLEFPANEYKGHFTELGHNGIAMHGVAHCWVRNVAMKNAESGIFLTGQFCTVAGLRLESERRTDRYKNCGHHGVMVTGQDNLLTDFTFATRYIHDITVSSQSVGNVISRGRGVDLCLDHHRRGPYENLFTALDAGAGTRLWASGGGHSLGRNAGAGNTYWNIRAGRPIPAPPRGFAPVMINLVGLRGQELSETVADGKWSEAIPPERLLPQDLHAAQRARRLGEAGRR